MGEKMAEPNGTVVGIGKTRNQYWDRAEKLVKDARDWANVVKLKQNLDNPETENSVWHVFRRYYGGDYGRLSAAVRRRFQICLDDAIRVNELAGKLGLQEVTEPTRLLELLLDYDRRKDWLALIEKHRKACVTVSLQEVERESRERQRRRDERRRQKRERARQKAEENRRRLEELAEREFEAERRKRGLAEGDVESRLPPELEEAIRKARKASLEKALDESDEDESSSDESFSNDSNGDSAPG